MLDVIDNIENNLGKPEEQKKKWNVVRVASVFILQEIRGVPSL